MDTSRQTYHWLGINKEGMHVNGTLKAVSVKDAHYALEKNGIDILKLVETKNTTRQSLNLHFKQTKTSPQDILFFTKYLATMLSAGLPITQSLEIISHDQNNAPTSNLIHAICETVKQGDTLSNALSKHPAHFNHLYCSIVKSGEQAGTLGDTLTQLASYLEFNNNLKRRVNKAKLYPIAIIFTVIFLTFLSLMFVIPQFEKMFTAFGSELPLLTQTIINLSHFTHEYWWALISIFIGGCILTKYAIYQIGHVKQFVDKWQLKIFIVGPIVRQSILAIFSRTLATTLTTGTPIAESLQITTEMVNNRVYKKAILGASKNVTTGKQLAVSLSASTLFPKMMIQMIAAGESTGSLEVMLNRIADYYESEVNATVDSLSSLLEPLMILLLGMLIGIFVIAMYVPIFQLGSLF